jgi:putative phage-type endonuclease
MVLLIMSSLGAKPVVSQKSKTRRISQQRVSQTPERNTVPFSSIGLPTELGSASFIGFFENGSDAWHAVRSQGVGGSEVGTICGLNKWESAFTLWAKKSGKIADQVKQSEPMEWGSRLEAVILDKFVESHPELEVWKDCGTWQKTDEPVFHANPDGIYKREDGSYGVIEIKTAAYPDDWEIGSQGVLGASSGVPRYYLTQVQHYLRVFGFKEAIVCALFTGNKYREYLIETDEFQQEIDADLVRKFWLSLEQDIAPDWDGSASTYESVRALNPELVDESAEIGELGEALLHAQEAVSAAESGLNLIKSMVIDIMGDAKKATSDGVVVAARQAGRNGSAPFLVIKKGK